MRSWYHGYKSFTFDALKQFKQKMIKFSSSHPSVLGFIIYFLLWFQVCKFRVGSFNYPMNKIVFYNELIPEDTIIKSILDYKWVYSPTLLVLTISRPGNFCKSDHAPPAATVVAVFMWKTPSLINSRRSCILDVRFF